MSMTCPHTEWHLPGRKMCNDCAAKNSDYHEELNQQASAKTRKLYKKEARMGSSEDNNGY